MSWNLATQYNNLTQVVKNLQTTALTNPMIAPLNMATYPINNTNNVNSQAGQSLTLTSPVSVVIPSPLTVNNTVSITNNTTNDSLIVNDSSPDTSAFRVDKDGNVGILVNPSTPLVNALTVNGNITANNLINSITAQTGITKTGTTSNPILSWTGYNLNNTFTGDNIFNGTTKMTLSNVNSGYVINYNPSTKLLTYDTTPSGSSILPTNNIFTGTNTFNNDTTINGNGAGTSSPKLYLSLTNFYTTINDPTNLYHIVQTVDNKCYYLNQSNLLTYSNQAIDVMNSDYVFDTPDKVRQLNNGFIYTSSTLTADRTISMPNGTTFKTGTGYGDYYSVSFKIFGGATSSFKYILDSFSVSPTDIVYFTLNNVQVPAPVSLVSGQYYNCSVEKYLIPSIATSITRYHLTAV